MSIRRSVVTILSTTTLVAGCTESPHRPEAAESRPAAASNMGSSAEAQAPESIGARLAAGDSDLRKGCAAGTTPCSVAPEGFSVCCSPRTQVCTEEGVCAPRPRPETDINGSLDLRYIVLDVLYPAPGNTSSLIYGSTASIGSSHDLFSGSTMKSSLDVKASASLGVVSQVGAGTQQTNNDVFSTGIEGGYSLKIDKSRNYQITLTSTTDRPVPGQHLFLIWTNPRLLLNQHTTGTGSSLFTGTFGTQAVGAGNEPMQVVAVFAKQLQNPALLSAQQAKLFSHLRAEDYQAILTHDPLLTHRPSDLPGRFDSLTRTVPVSGPVMVGDPTLQTLVSISSGSFISDTITNTTTGVRGTGNGVNIMFALLIGIGYDNRTSIDVTNTQRRTAVSTGSNVSTVSASLGSSTVGFNSTFNVYVDKLYGTLAFEDASDPHAVAAAGAAPSGATPSLDADRCTLQADGTLSSGCPQVTLGCAAGYASDGHGNCVAAASGAAGNGRDLHPAGSAAQRDKRDKRAKRSSPQPKS